MAEAPDFSRRFGGVARLYGEAGLQRLQAAHVAVIGLGGVGSWAAEALARTAVGRLTLIDLDMVAESNTNRQLHALGDVYGQAKVAAMATRIMGINPACQVACIEDFVTLDNLSELLTQDFDVVIDAIDQARVKVAMIAHCRRQRLPVVVDLSQTTQDPLLAKVRASLRREYAFPRQGKFGVAAVYSTEPLRYPAMDGKSCDTSGAAPQGLNCAGFGSAVCVTSVFGMVAASWAINRIALD